MKRDVFDFLAPYKAQYEYIFMLRTVNINIKPAVLLIKDGFGGKQSDWVKLHAALLKVRKTNPLISNALINYFFINGAKVSATLLLALTVRDLSFSTWPLKNFND